MTGGTGPLDRKEALLGPNLAGPLTGRTGHRLGTTRGARALTFVTARRGVDLDPRLLALEGVFQPDIQIVAKIRTTCARPPTATAATASHKIAEHLIKDIGKTTLPGRIETTTGATAAAIFKSLMAVTIIGRALLFILQDVVGLVDFLEALLGLVVARIAVGMQLLGEAAIGRLDRRRIRAAINPKCFVIIFIRH